jgi:hypothetical protein
MPKRGPIRGLHSFAVLGRPGLHRPGLAWAWSAMPGWKTVAFEHIGSGHRHRARVAARTVLAELAREFPPVGAPRLKDDHLLDPGAGSRPLGDSALTSDRAIRAAVERPAQQPSFPGRNLPVPSRGRPALAVPTAAPSVLVGGTVRNRDFSGLPGLPRQHAQGPARWRLRPGLWAVPRTVGDTVDVPHQGANLGR